MLKKQSDEKRKNEIPNEAIKRSEEVRNPSQTGKFLKKSGDPFNEDRMSRTDPSDETARTAYPDDTVLPG